MMDYEYIKFIDNINWDSPVIFVILILVLFGLYSKWKIFWFSILTFTIAWLTNDLIIKNLLTSSKIIDVPDLVYIVGGIVIAFAAIISFTKFIIE